MPNVTKSTTFWFFKNWTQIIEQSLKGLVYKCKQLKILNDIFILLIGYDVICVEYDIFCNVYLSIWSWRLRTFSFSNPCKDIWRQRQLISLWPDTRHYKTCWIFYTNKHYRWPNDLWNCPIKLSVIYDWLVDSGFWVWWICSLVVKSSIWRTWLPYYT